MLTEEKVPQGVIEIRREICTRCPTPCGPFMAKTLDFANPCLECPLKPRRWGPYGRCKDAQSAHREQRGPTAPTNPKYGLGDAVAAVAQPIAGAIDAVLGTNIKGCGGCRKRQAALNKIVPNL